MSEDEKKEKQILKVGIHDEDKFERLKRIGWIDLEKVEKANILVVGAGALGNEVIKNLVLSGFKNISLVDMDFIVKSNLNRCVFFLDSDAAEKKMKADVLAEKARLLEPTVNITPYTKKIQELPEDFIRQHTIVLGCLDNILARMHLNSHTYHAKIPYIDGGTLGVVGKVQVILPPETPCLECTMNKMHMKNLEKLFSCTGRDVTFFEPKLAAEITTTSIISAIQVRETLKIVCGHKDWIVKNIFYYDGTRNVSEILEASIDANCIHHIEVSSITRPTFTQEFPKEKIELPVEIHESVTETSKTEKRKKKRGRKKTKD